MATVKRIVPQTWRCRIKIGRARLFEAFGSWRYSHPARDGIDRLAMEVFVEPGTFLEIGANDGYTQSNTYFLERFANWRGVLVEPLPELAAICRKLRRRSTTFAVACDSVGGGQITIVDSCLTSSVPTLSSRNVAPHSRSHTVPTATLSQLIDDAGFGRIHLMSIDVEGAETHVLAGLDCSRHAPDLLIVETTAIEEVMRLLQPPMLCLGLLKGFDWIFVVPDRLDTRQLDVLRAHTTMLVV